jgi:hypothetical protein
MPFILASWNDSRLRHFTSCQDLALALGSACASCRLTSVVNRRGVASFARVREVADPKCRCAGVGRPRWIEESPRSLITDVEAFIGGRPTSYNSKSADGTSTKVSYLTW